MSVEIIHDNKCLTAVITGELDHHSAADIRIAVEGELERSMPDMLVFDMDGVTFMDSSGVGLILGRARTVKQWGGKVRISRPSPRAEKILKLSGLSGLIAGKPTGKETAK
ncbi:MAG: STAS domain-containing protein [Ruminiclostridium sp.]|nr:STAS domain-containing protein [Ruminiclostridium sp.]